MSENLIEIKYKKAFYQFHIFERFIAGIVLKGTEIKSIRGGKCSFTDPFCVFIKGELWIKGLHISEYSHGNIFNHDPKRDKKLLLQRKELNKLEKKVREKGFTIIPIKLFINENGFAKVEIALAKGKKQYDKREDIKKRDQKRDIEKSRNRF
ncbi:MAG: SsrA-binding protein [Marinilabiliales bacterium]